MRTDRQFSVLDKVIKYKNPWMTVWELQTETDGKKGIYGIIERADSSVAIIETDDKRILFLKQFRFPTGEYSWELPMGGIDSNESPISAAVRELEEEAGITINLERIGTFRPVPGLTPQRASVFYGRIGGDDICKVEKYDEAVDEITDRRFLTREEIRIMISEGLITDGFTLSSLALFIWR